jgi:hypothetical protein
VDRKPGLGGSDNARPLPLRHRPGRVVEPLARLMNRHLVRGAAVMAVLVGTATIGAAGGGPFTRGCAARDMQIMMMLEQRANAAQDLNEILNTIVDARMVCSAGRVLDALEMYDGVARRIASGRLNFGQ